MDSLSTSCPINNNLILFQKPGLARRADFAQEPHQMTHIEDQNKQEKVHFEDQGQVKTGPT